MNRIIVIGNGFDKAHGLATGYRDFMDKYWTDFLGRIFGGYWRWITETSGVINDPHPYEDEFVLFEVFRDKQHEESGPLRPQLGPTPYDDVLEFIATLNEPSNENYEGSVRLTFKNRFFGHISGLCSLTNWLDIENEYYTKLKVLLAEDDAVLRNGKVRELNKDFDAVKKRLESYLTQIIGEAQIEPIPAIREVFDSLIEFNDVAYGKQKIFVESILQHIVRIDKKDVVTVDKEDDPDYLFCSSRDEERKYYVLKQLHDEHFRETHCKPSDTLILNFNYTQTAKKLYARMKDGIINIHGELGSARNPIIFGYGDELDDDYKRIERLQDNDFLENIKSVRYHETGNYRRLLGFIESEPYQVVTMGHSCGNSDRTLLNTLLEHPNCISVKVYYHQRENGTDDYSQLVRNLSRNFNDKAALRDKVVHKERCAPLVPVVVQK